MYVDYGPVPGMTSKQIEIDFGSLPVQEQIFTITDPDVSPTSIIIAQVAYEAPTGKQLDEMTMDQIELKCGAGSGQFQMFAKGHDGYVADKFKVSYTIG